MSNVIKMEPADYEERTLNDFLANVAKNMGVSDSDVEEYAICRIHVAENIQTAWIKHYLGKGYSMEELNSLMLVFFPRVDLSLANGEVLVEDDAIVLRQPQAA